jgi:hypothetical protein
VGGDNKFMEIKQNKIIFLALAIWRNVLCIVMGMVICDYRRRGWRV